MANFKTHITISAISSAILAETLLSMGILTPVDALVAFVFGVAGGILPDIDSDYSKSVTLLFNIISMSITTILLFMLTPRYSLLEIFMISGAVFVLIRFGFIGIFRWISVHRGMMHSIPMAIVLGLVVVIVMEALSEVGIVVSWIYGLMLTVNYFIHLVLDELYSIDLNNQKIKRSAGTALKLFRLKTLKEKVDTLIVYLSLMLLFYLSPDSQLFVDTIFTQEAWTRFVDVLLPYDGRWFFH